MTPKHLCLISILATIAAFGACSSSGGDSPNANDAQKGETESLANKGQPAGGARSTFASQTTASAANTQLSSMNNTQPTAIDSVSSGDIELVRSRDVTLGTAEDEALAEPGLDGSGQPPGAALATPAVPIASDAKPQMLLLGVNDALELAARVALACDLVTPEDSRFDTIVVSGGPSRSAASGRPDYLRYTEAILMKSLFTKTCITDVNWGPNVGTDCEGENSDDILKMRINGLLVDTWKFDQEVISKGSSDQNYEGSKRAMDTFQRMFALDPKQTAAPEDFYTLVFQKLDACASSVKKKIAGNSLKIVLEDQADSTVNNLCKSFESGSGKSSLVDVKRPLWVVSTHHHAYSTAACAALKYYQYDITKQAPVSSPVHAYYTCETQNGKVFGDPKLDHATLCSKNSQDPDQTCKGDYPPISGRGLYDTCDRICGGSAQAKLRCTSSGG